MAGYGLKSVLIAQSLNQIEKAYGPNNAILDNCHVRVSFATNDERTAKRVSDALGTATEMRAMKNYAGHRLSPWLGHLMVSRQETARPLLTSGEVMQLPPSDELVLVSGLPPIRARKARYYEDIRLAERVLPPPVAISHHPRPAPSDDWSGRSPISVILDPNNEPDGPRKKQIADRASTDKRRQPELSQQEEGVQTNAEVTPEFTFGEEGADDDAVRAQGFSHQARSLARQAAMDPGDNLKLGE